jgi:protoheme IX farnesyltransferase
VDGHGPDPSQEDWEDKAPGEPQGSLALIKPKVLVLLVLAGVTGFTAAGDVSGDSLVRLSWLLVGGFLATASANVFNNILDRERDSLMSRTMWRPLPAGTVGPVPAAIIGTVLGLLGLGLLYLMLNPATALLTAVGMVYYIVVYTFVLKPRTYENITIGGVAGAFPPLVGWVAVTGEVDWPPIVLGSMIVLWTPPHFWSLALFHKEDYKRAGFPMLPVIKGVRATHVRIVGYSIALLVASIAYYWIDVRMNWPYFYGIIILNIPILILAGSLLQGGSMVTARKLFMYSNLYLSLVFILIMVDALFV